MNKITFEEFSARVEKNYNGRISVVKESFIGLSTGKRVKAHCNVHNIDFEPEARGLWKGESNCHLCSKEKRHKSRQLPWNKALEKFRKAYGDRFSYDEKTYDGMKSDMVVHCNVCGETFKISPVHHLKYNNGGCPNCHTHRIVKCSCCGKEIEADRHVNGKSIMYCEKCRREKYLLRRGRNTHRTIKDKSDYIKIEKELLKKHKTKEEANKIISKRYFCKICGIPLNEHRKCDNDFCKDKHYQSFNQLIKYFTFDQNKLGTIDVENEFNRVRDMLYDMYWIKHMSSSQICKFFNYPYLSHLTYDVFRFLKIPSKTVSQGVSENILMKRVNTASNYMFKDKHHISWDNKKVYLRSSYESDFANMLDEQQVVYEVENLRIRYYDTQKQKERIAVPDFYLPDTNTIVEVKSSWTFDKQNMIDKRIAYLELGYNFKLWYEHEYVELDDISNKENNLEVYKHKYDND